MDKSQCPNCGYVGYDTEFCTPDDDHDSPYGDEAAEEAGKEEEEMLSDPVTFIRGTPAAKEAGKEEEEMDGAGGPGRHRPCGGRDRGRMSGAERK